MGCRVKLSQHSVLTVGHMGLLVNGLLVTCSFGSLLLMNRKDSRAHPAVILRAHSFSAEGTADGWRHRAPPCPVHRATALRARAAKCSCRCPMRPAPASVRHGRNASRRSSPTACHRAARAARRLLASRPFAVSAWSRARSTSSRGAGDALFGARFICGFRPERSSMRRAIPGTKFGGYGC